MGTHNRLVRWTFTRLRNSSAAVSDARVLGRRYRELTHRTVGARVRRSVKRSDFRAAVIANTL